MKGLLIALGMLVVAVIVALGGAGDNGYVVVGRGDWVLQLSLSLFALALVVVVALLYGLARLAALVWGMPGAVRALIKAKRQGRSRRGLNRGLAALTEGRWGEAERRLADGALDSEVPLLNWLGAARAAEGLGVPERRDRYLHLAHASVPSAELAVGITQAEFQLAGDRLEQALATLLQLREKAPDNSQVIHSLVKLLRRMGEWQRLVELLPAWRASKGTDQTEADALEAEAWGHLLWATEDVSAAKQSWSRIPPKMQRRESLTALYAELLLGAELDDEAESLLGDAVERKWGEALVYLYGRAQGAHPARQLERAEGWLSKHGQEPALLQALGRVCMRGRLWGKARDYLQASIAARPEAETYQVLVELLEQINEHVSAAKYAREGLAHVVQHRSASQPSHDQPTPAAAGEGCRLSDCSLPGPGMSW
ncbi:MAG: heme biosynthesis protein HemY [Gammaproteobacteria bacterium]|nr:MAG: heme biosynthesis protein HemY [Gammaproteobacteria bacterium]